MMTDTVQVHNFTNKYIMNRNDIAVELAQLTLSLIRICTHFTISLCEVKESQVGGPRNTVFVLWCATMCSLL